MEKKETTLQDAKEHKITEEEFGQIQKILGRVPNSTELGIFSAMWSEHCSYKNSILKLKTLPTDSPLMLAKAGEENAGALDIGDGLGVVFKIESHNHPTAVEPYQGAATGVGGIMRDIFTMGARPIASLNSLRFGPYTLEKNQYLLSRAVKGIGDYGNALGIAVAGGELFIHPCFSKNPLVNAMTVGIVDRTKMAKATTGGVIGAKVFIVGSTTGRDGIHGASFASQDLTKETEAKRSAVQVGDPFMEKLLLEATLEAIDQNVLIGIQDMGAAGISCATSEMSAKGKTGMDVFLDKVPFRETGMNAYEAMLSESQERMLVVSIPGKEKELCAIFEKWDLLCVEMGVVTSGNTLRIFKDGEIKAEIPADSLVLGGGAPRYVRAEKKPAYLNEVQQLDLSKIPDLLKQDAGKEVFSKLQSLLQSPNICSRLPLFDQYDTEVGRVKLIPPGSDGGLVKIPGTKKAIGVSVDCNSRYTFLDPYEGAKFAVAEACRNVIVTGAVPIGVTNNLNFANPYIPENYYVFSECVRGLGDACRDFQIPVTGGNVSFYNESPEGPIYPTPTIGVVGYLEDYETAILPYPQKPGLSVGLLFAGAPTLEGSEYLFHFHNLEKGKVPKIDCKLEKATWDLVLGLNQKKLIQSLKDVSLGGVSVALAKQAFGSGLGIQLDTSALEKIATRIDASYFGEMSNAYLLSYEPSALELIQAEVQKKSGLQFLPLGQWIAEFKMVLGSYQKEIDLLTLKKSYETELVKVFGEL